jgi:hypothetical protein
MALRLPGRVRFVPLLGSVALLLTTVPLFFDIYRTAAFNTVSRDDYAPYLLALVGESGKFPGSPAGYRLFSVALAIPFYYLLPLYTFKTLDVVDIPYLRATQALSMVSYLSIVLTAILVGKIARRRYGATILSSVTVALLSIFLTDLVGRPGIDTVAVLMISLIVYYQDNAAAFTLLLFVSVCVNEKIPILFTAVMGSRFVFSIWRPRSDWGQRTPYWQLLPPILGVATYGLARAFVELPGHDEQTSLDAFGPSVLSTIAHTLSMKGLVLNLLPIAVLVLIVIVAVKGNEARATHGILPVADLAGFLVLLMLAAVANLGYTMGRVVLYSFPLYLPATARVLDKEFGP